MNNKNNGISSDDIMKAAAFFDDDDDAVQVAQTTVNTGVAKNATPSKITSEDIKNAAMFFDDDDAPVQVPKAPVADSPVVNTVASKITSEDIRSAAMFFDDDDEAPVIKPVAEPKVEPVIKTVAEPKAEPVIKTVAEPKVEPVINPVAEPNKGAATVDVPVTADSKPGFDAMKIVNALRKVYLFDVLWRAGEAKNWGLIIWIIINLALVATIGTIFEPMYLGIIIAATIYIISLYIAVSPIGEFLLRHQNACKKITDKKILERIMPIFNKVYEQAKEKSPHISPKIQLFMCNEESVNAFATGRRTVCITKGLLSMDDDYIEAILAHEFGHLANRDTDSLLIVVVGNIIVTVITTILAAIFNIIGFIVDHAGDKESHFGRAIAAVASLIFVTGVMFVWTKLGALFCMRGNRKQEYAADKYAAELGQAQNLIDAFCAMDDAPAPKGLWATLVSTHPETADRIMKLNEYIDSQNVAISNGD